MLCGGCGKGAPRIASPQRRQEMRNMNPTELIVEKSDDDTRVKIRYFGGGMTRQTTGCSSCGSQGKYALTTSEIIQFASDDAPGGWFSQRFDISQDYYVTPKQAEYLTKLTFTNPFGQVINKFKIME